MPKAKPIDRVASTKDGNIYVYPPVPVQRLEVVYDEERGVVVDREPVSKHAGGLNAKAVESTAKAVLQAQGIQDR